MKKALWPPGMVLSAALDKLRHSIRLPSTARWLKPLKYGALGFLLGAAGCRTAPLPLAAGLLCGIPFGLQTVAACLGGVGGTLLFWGFRQALEPAAVLLLTFVAQGLFEGTSLKKTRFFMPMLVSSLTAVLGVLFLLEGSETSRLSLAMFLLRVALSGLSVLAFSWSEGSPGSPADWFVAGAYVMALAQFSLFSRLDLGICAAAMLACTAQPGLGALPMAAVCGIALDLAGITPVMLTPVLCLCALGAAAVPKKQLRFLFPPLLSLPVMLLSGKFDLMVPLSLGVGGLLALFLPRGMAPQAVQEVPGTDPDAAKRLQSVSGVLSRIQTILLTDDPAPEQDVAAAVFDQATDQVCQTCIHFPLCWQKNGTETYRLLESAAPHLLQKGTAEESDLPEGFLEKCRRPEPFLEAVNQALFAHRYQEKCRAQLAESRAVICSQYQFLSGYLAETAEQLDSPAFRHAAKRFKPEIGIRAAGKYGMAVSGDRGACFAGPGSLYYVVLCDGMGTGPGAAQEGETALNLLTGLLQAGLDASDALEMLNGLYLLRNSGCFSTADLLELHLDTGRAVLYKWGAAPSYVKHQNYAKKVGTAGPPPGLGIGGTCQAEVIRLSLMRGETVVLVSDGISGEETRQRIAGFADRSPKALANYIIAGAGQEGEDDMTAVAVTLRPLMPSTG